MNSNTFTLGRNILLKNTISIKKKDGLIIWVSISKYSDFVSIACLLWQSETLLIHSQVLCEQYSNPNTIILLAAAILCWKKKYTVKRPNIPNIHLIWFQTKKPLFCLWKENNYKNTLGIKIPKIFVAQSSQYIRSYFISDEVYIVLNSELIYMHTQTFSSVFPHKYFGIWVITNNQVPITQCKWEKI